jgi:hypothetical protein
VGHYRPRIRTDENSDVIIVIRTLSTLVHKGLEQFQAAPRDCLKLTWFNEEVSVFSALHQSLTKTTRIGRDSTRKILIDKLSRIAGDSNGRHTKIRHHVHR